MEKGILVILSGPSGSGKDTILEELLKINPDISLSTSLTTRTKRNWEEDGKHYYFVTREYFLKKLDEGMVLEHVQYGENFYGVPKQPVDELLAQGKTVILKIEVQGAEKIRSLYPDVCSIFLMPPSLPVLESRLRQRETEDEEEIQRRLSIAAGEMQRAGEYDYIIVNDCIDTATADVNAILRAEEHRAAHVKHHIAALIRPNEV